jgi:uncharacterized protein (TIGR03382 family)
MRAGASNATQSARRAEFDELRLGLSYADVTPVPEPASAAAALMLMGVSLLSVRRRC